MESVNVLKNCDNIYVKLFQVSIYYYWGLFFFYIPTICNTKVMLIPVLGGLNIHALCMYIISISDIYASKLPHRSSSVEPTSNSKHVTLL
jgi:hypothetical protein